MVGGQTKSNGNVTVMPTGVAGQTLTCSYDAENRIWKSVLTVSGVSQTAAYHFYDAGGARVKKSQGATEVRYVAGVSGATQEYSSATVVQKEYVYGASGILATVESPATGSPVMK